jgi:predicted phosphodiesterase
VKPEPSKDAPEKKTRKVKIVCISDTHSKHNKIVLPDDADILIVAGDISTRGRVKEI